MSSINIFVSPLSAVPFLGTYIQWVPFPKGALIFTTGTYRRVPSFRACVFPRPKATMVWPSMAFFFQQMEAQNHDAHDAAVVNLAGTLITYYTGWWFQPLWKILVSWDDYSQYMENKCSKPPTSIISAMLSSFLSVHTSWHPQEMYFLCTRF